MFFAPSKKILHKNSHGRQHILRETPYQCAFFLSLFFHDKKGQIMVFLLTEDEKSYLMTSAVEGYLRLNFIIQSPFIFVL